MARDLPLGSVLRGDREVRRRADLLGGRRHPLEQAKLAIEALRALVPVLRDSLPSELTRDFESVTANLQLAYAKAVEEERQAVSGEEAEPPPDREPPAD